MNETSPFEAAVQYHIICEEFDRSVCSGPMGRDGILPANPREAAAINQHALNIRTRMAKQARMLPRDFDEVIRDERVHREANRRLAQRLSKTDSQEERARTLQNTPPSTDTEGNNE
jgi:hypothetical protein